MSLINQALEAIPNCFDYSKPAAQIKFVEKQINQTVESLIKVRKNTSENKIAQVFGNPAIGNFRPFFNPRGYMVPRDQSLFRMYNRNNQYNNPRYTIPNCRPVAYCLNQDAMNLEGQNNNLASNKIKQITNPFNPKKENLNLV